MALPSLSRLQLLATEVQAPSVLSRTADLHAGDSEAGKRGYHAYANVKARGGSEEAAMAAAAATATAVMGKQLSALARDPAGGGPATDTRLRSLTRSFRRRRAHDDRPRSAWGRPSRTISAPVGHGRRRTAVGGEGQQLSRTFGSFGRLPSSLGVRVAAEKSARRRLPELRGRTGGRHRTLPAMPADARRVSASAGDAGAAPRPAAAGRGAEGAERASTPQGERASKPKPKRKQVSLFAPSGWEALDW